MNNTGRLAYVVQYLAAFQQLNASRPGVVNATLFQADKRTMETWFPGEAERFPATLVLREGSTEEQRVLIRGTLLRVHATQTPYGYYDFEFTADEGQPTHRIFFALTRSNIEKLVMEKPNGRLAEVHSDQPLALPTRTATRKTMRN